jgi:hypothetical protein
MSTGQGIDTMTFRTLGNDTKLNFAGSVIMADQAGRFRVNITVLFISIRNLASSGPD